MDRTGLAFNNRRLHWVERDRSNTICHHCGNLNHLYKDCPNRKPHPEQQLCPNRWTETYQRMRPDGFKSTNARSQSRSHARSANRRQGFSYASAASSSAKTDLDNSIHSPANRNRNNNNRNSNSRFQQNSTSEQESTHSTPSISVSDLKEFTAQLKRLESVITRLDDSFSHLAAKFDDVNSHLISFEENMETDHHPNPSLWNNNTDRHIIEEDATSNVSGS